MTASIVGITEQLLATTRDVYADDESVLEIIDQLEERLHEPLRLALAGMVKAGKSTLLNAMLGERIAPTDTGECTRVVTWYRYSPTPTITLHPRTGAPRRMPIRRDRGLLVLDLGDLSAEEVEWIDVGWPLQALKSVILIDTPGIASLSADTSTRAFRFLTPDDAPSAADAVVYLLRHLHGSDVKFLEAFRDNAAGAAQTVCAVSVLSRADEVGSGRIDSLLSARRVAHRYQRDPELASLTLGVIPVTGLLAEGARTLRESEYIAFRELSALDRDERERLLVSADRFLRETDATGLSVIVRRDLLARFGIFGVRMATAIIRGGASSSSELSEELVQQSGLLEIQDFVAGQFQPRAATLKARGIVLQLERLTRDFPRAGTEAIRAGIEHFTLAAHTLRELSLLADARSKGLPLADEDAAEAERIIGAEGTDAPTRLGLSPQADAAAVHAAAREGVARWRRMSSSPLADRAVLDVCRVVIRTLEQIASEASEVGPGRSLRATASDDVDTAGRPPHGAGQDAAQQRQDDEPGLRRDHRLKLRAVGAQSHPLG
ncbi:dynamin family protein [Microbacterium aerolatum]|uniref:GTPase n=1 Tax=Microbacterium aerolatum TaxID=153731 RepID=A0A511AJH0_9MICO|nr:dynamin family protein [Microbacterium aerolatum]GEK86951.1 GTPase [Microbacterium aerolatum]GGB15681.1 GTPase [Microbacterium aerolatum]